jgi:hypothetical protein
LGASLFCQSLGERGKIVPMQAVVPAARPVGGSRAIFLHFAFGEGCCGEEIGALARRICSQVNSSKFLCAGLFSH